MRRLLILILSIVVTLPLTSCGGGDGGGSSDKNSPITTIQGPDGSTLTTSVGALNGEASIKLTESPDPSRMADENEALVSKVLLITTSSDDALMGDGTFSLSIPVDGSSVTDTGKLELKVMLTTGIAYPIAGVYDAATGLFKAQVSGVVNGWEIAVVEDPSIQIIQVSSGITPSGASPIAVGVWLTDLDWKTYEWSVVNHTAMTEVEIKEKILPVLWDTSRTLAEAGFRSPKIYIDPRLSPQARVVHLIGGVGPNDGGSHFAAGSITYADGSWTYTEDQSSFSTILLDDDQLSALGQLHINYDQFLNLNQQYGVSLGNIIIHELFHAVQAGYDVRKQQKSLAAYLEGTATPIGQTYQNTGGSITGPSAPSVRVLRPNEHARLYQAVDDPTAPLQYTKQDFFAYVAKRYGNNSFAFTEQMFEYMNTWTANKFDLAAAQYRELYRKATDEAFSAIFKKGLSAVFKEYALDRAYEHGEHAILRSGEETEQNGFGPNHLAKTLFQWNTTDTKGFKELKPETSPSVEFQKIEPLSCYAFYMRVPDQSDSDATGAFPLLFKAEGGEILSSSDSGLKIFAFLEDAYEDMVADGKIEITDISKTVMIPFKEDAVYLTVLIMNCYLEDKNVKVTVSSGPYIASISPNPAAPGDEIMLKGLSFGTSQEESILSLAGEELSEITYWSDTEIHFTLPNNAESGKVKATVNSVSSNEVELEVEEEETNAQPFSFVQSWSKSHFPSGWDPEAATIDFTASVSGQVQNAMNPKISLGDFNVENAKIINISNMKTSEVVTIQGEITMTLSKTTIAPETPTSKYEYTYSNPTLSRYEDGVFKETYPGMDFTWVVSSTGIYNDSDFYVKYTVEEKRYTRENESSPFTLSSTSAYDNSQEFHLEINVDKDVPYWDTP